MIFNGHYTVTFSDLHSNFINVGIYRILNKRILLFVEKRKSKDLKFKYKNKDPHLLMN